MAGKGAEWRSRILRKQKGEGSRAEEGRRAPCSRSQLGGRTDGAPFGAGWEARKFPPDVPPLPVKWEAGSCRDGGEQRRRGVFGFGGGAAGGQLSRLPSSGHAQPENADHTNKNTPTPDSDRTLTVGQVPTTSRLLAQSSQQLRGRGRRYSYPF